MLKPLKMSKSKNVIVGVDNGLGGGLCALSATHGLVIDHCPMPVERGRKKDRISVKDFLTWLRKFDPGSTLVAVEEPLHFAKTLASMRSMAISFGMILGACETAGYHVERVQVRDWQPKMLGRFPRGQSKAAALRRAKMLWPDETWLAGPKCRTPHDGIVDAALIGYYHLSTQL